MQFLKAFHLYSRKNNSISYRIQEFFGFAKILSLTYAYYIIFLYAFQFFLFCLLSANQILRGELIQKRQKRGQMASKPKRSFFCLFLFCRYVNFVDSICSRFAANPKSSFFASGNPSRSNSIYCRYAPIRYDINPRSRSEHIELLMAHNCHQQYIERVSVYRKSVSADLYRCVNAPLRASR